MKIQNVIKFFLVSILGISTHLAFAASSNSTEQQKPSPSDSNQPVVIVLTVTKDGWKRVNGKSTLWAETFVFDEKTGRTEIAKGPQLSPVGGYPVPLVITNLGYNLSGTFSAIYRNVVFNCEQLTPDNRLIFLAGVDVQKGFSFDVKINSKGCENILITADHRVFPARHVYPNLKKSSVDFRVTTKEIGKTEKDSKLITGALVTILRQSGQKSNVSTDANGVATFSLSDPNENVVHLEVSHPQKRLFVKYPIPITRRGYKPGLVIYEIPIDFKNEANENQ
jgi:hypothetical protein